MGTYCWLILFASASSNLDKSYLTLFTVAIKIEANISLYLSAKSEKQLKTQVDEGDVYIIMEHIYLQIYPIIYPIKCGENHSCNG